MDCRFVLKGNNVAGYRFRLETEEHGVILGSERVADKEDALRAIARTRLYAPRPGNFERRGNQVCGFSFVLRSPRGSHVVTGVAHRTEAARDSAMAVTLRHAADAKLVDATEWFTVDGVAAAAE